MTKAFIEGFWNGLSLGWLWCAIRRKHGPWRRHKGGDIKHCRVCGTAVKIKKRNPKIACG
jgi:hypothetical protein